MKKLLTIALVCAIGLPMIGFKRLGSDSPREFLKRTFEVTGQKDETKPIPQER
tara:strand:+ start:340 stop:498 length:159 start_codon:yes stop_codon:yes gene_type:complete